MCLAQGHNTVTPVSLEPAAPRSRVKHSTTEPLHQQITEGHPNLKLWNTIDIFIKMSIIHLWCNDASWSLILCALHYSCIQLINLTMPFPHFDRGPKKVILTKVPLKMTWWQNTHFKHITWTALCCNKISNLWLIWWRHLLTLIRYKAKTKSTLKRSFLRECSCS